MHGTAFFRRMKLAALNDRVQGSTMGPLKLTPPVDESISELARRTAVIGEKILRAHGAELEGDKLAISTEQPVTQAPELFKLSDFTAMWNPDWTLERAGYGGAGGGIKGIRGDTYLDGEVLAVFPRDEVRGALLRRSAKLSDTPSLDLDAGVDAGRTWNLVVFVNNDKLLDQMIQGDALTPDNASDRHWDHIHLDLKAYAGQTVVIRLYDLVLVPNHEAGNSYWKRVQLQ